MEVHNNNCQQFSGTSIDGMVIINGNVIRAAKELSVENNKVFINGKLVEEYSNVPPQNRDYRNRQVNQNHKRKCSRRR